MKRTAREQEEQYTNVIECFSQPIGWIHSFYLGDIEESQNYYRWFEIIRNATPDDKIIININSVGGNYFTAVQFCRVMAESKAEICCNIEGECHSAASIIFLAGDSFSVSQGSSMLCHDYNSSAIGKGSELLKSIVHEKNTINRFLEDTYKDFMTDEEIKQTLSGIDFWLSDQEIIERTQRMVELRSKRMEEMFAAQEEKPKRGRQPKNS